MDRRRVLAAAGGGIATSLAGCIGISFGPSETEDFSEQYDASDDTVVAIENRNGPVTVDETDGNEIVVTGEKGAGSQSVLDSITVDVVEGDRFVVTVEFESGFTFANRSVDLTVSLPAGVTFDRASTDNGDVTVEDVTGDAIARTSNGDVEIVGVDGYVGAESANGDVEVRQTTGVTGARTSNGSVDVELLAIRSDVECRSSNGDVTVHVGPDVSTPFRLETSNGDARVRDLEYTASTESQGFIEGTLHDGGDTLLTLSSSNGDVTLRALEEE